MFLQVSNIVYSSWQYILILFYAKRVSVDTQAHLTES